MKLGHAAKAGEVTYPPLRERPELPGQAVPGEQRRCRKRTGGLPVDVEPGCIPVRAEFIEGLWRHRRPFFVAARFEPVVQFALRPEGCNVRSGEADVVPEGASWHQEVNQPRAAHLAIGHFEPEGRSGPRCVGGERAVAEQRQDR